MCSDKAHAWEFMVYVPSPGVHGRLPMVYVPSPGLHGRLPMVYVLSPVMHRGHHMLHVPCAARTARQGTWWHCRRADLDNRSGGTTDDLFTWQADAGLARCPQLISSRIHCCFISCHNYNVGHSEDTTCLDGRTAALAQCSQQTVFLASLLIPHLHVCSACAQAHEVLNQVSTVVVDEAGCVPGG